jgi:hypothetical protein
MLSADFLASDFVNRVELPRLIEAAAQDHIAILQVVLQPIKFNRWSLAKFQAINDPTRPLGKMGRPADRDEVWVKVTDALLEALESSPSLAKELAIEKTAETIALIQRQSPKGPALESEEDRQPPSTLSSTGSLAPTDGGRVLTKEPTPSTEKIPLPIRLVEPNLQGATKAAPRHQALSWIQIAWWRLIEVWDEFKSCRLSLITLIAAYFLFFLWGTDVFRVLGEGPASDRNYWLQVVTFFLALFLWGVCNWYTARALFYFDFPGVRRRLPSTASWDVRFDKTAAASPTCSTRDLANLHLSECLFLGGHNKQR